MAAIDVENVMNNPNAQVRIALPGKGTRAFRGYMEGELAISASNSFNTPFQSQALSNLTSKVNVAKNVTESLINANLSKSGTGQVDFGGEINLQNLSHTLMSWNGSQKPQFSLNLLFFALREDDDVRNPVSSLYRTVFPTVRPNTSGFLLDAPLGYSAKLNAQNRPTSKGTFAIEIGEWFKTNGMVMTNVNFTFSNEKIASGAPLYAFGSISFEKFRGMLLNEFLNMMGINSTAFDKGFVT